MIKRPKKYESSKIMLEVSGVVSSSLDFDKVSGLVLKESMDALKTDHASLFLIDELSGHLMLAKAAGFSEDEIENIKLLGGWEVVNEQLVKRRRYLIANDVHSDPVFKNTTIPFFHERIPIASFLAVPLQKDTQIIGALIVSNRKRPGHRFAKADAEFLLTLSNHIAIALMNAKLYQKLKEFFIDTVVSLTRAIDAKDPYTCGHSERVMKYAVAIGKEMRLSDEALENLRLSSLLHDVGKIGIREKILYKPTRLVGYEKSQMHKHPVIGAEIVGTIDSGQRIIKGILEHHERFDGKGYPNRLKGRNISLEGRIIAVADTFDALTTNRPYHKKYTAKEAFFEIESGSSTQFDPRCAKAFALSFSRHPWIWKV